MRKPRRGSGCRSAKETNLGQVRQKCRSWIKARPASRRPGLSLYSQCYTQEEIAERVGMPFGSIPDLFLRIRKYGIPRIPGQFAEHLPDEGASQEEIGEAEGVSRSSVEAILSEFSDLKKLTKSHQAAAEHATDFETPTRGHDFP